MRWDSFRVRLTVWNMAILALVLGVGGLTFYFAVRGWMRHSIDQELSQRVHGRAFPTRETLGTSTVGKVAQ